MNAKQDEKINNLTGFLNNKMDKMQNDNAVTMSNMESNIIQAFHRASNPHLYLNDSSTVENNQHQYQNPGNKQHPSINAGNQHP